MFDDAYIDLPEDTFITTPERPVWDPEEWEDRDLTRARLHWSTGTPLPIDLTADLVSKGYDVEALERRYLV